MDVEGWAWIPWTQGFPSARPDSMTLMSFFVSFYLADLTLNFIHPFQFAVISKLLLCTSQV